MGTKAMMNLALAVILLFAPVSLARWEDPPREEDLMSPPHNDDNDNVDEPTTSPRVDPPPEPCTSDNGDFGTIGQGEATEVAYYYELETDVSKSEIPISVLPGLEQAFTDAILSELFADCGRRSIRRRLALQGVSKYRDDLILESIECTSRQEDANTCVVVSGILTLYADTGAATQEAESVKQLLQREMTAGTFVGGSVVRVAYLDQVTPEANPGTSTAGRENPSPDVAATNTGVRVGLFVAMGLVVTTMIGIAYRRGRFRSTEHGESDASQLAGESTILPESVLSGQDPPSTTS